MVLRVREKNRKSRLENMSNSTFYLAVYGSVISTMALSWNIVQYIRSRKGKLKINASLNTKIPVTNSRSTMSAFTSIDISVVNLSEKTRYVKQPRFELDQVKNRFMDFLDLDNPIKYPVELSPGQEFTVWYNLQNIDEDSFNKIVADKFKIFIVDTHGKEYKSQWYDTKEFQLKK